MNCEVDFSEEGVGQVHIAGQWLSNGRLPICFAKPPRRVDEIPENAVSAATLAFAHAILGGGGDNAGAPLQTWFNGLAGLLIFPEYAFSSRDFNTIDVRIRAYPSRIIVLAGFGAAKGSEIGELLKAGCLASWKDGSAALTVQGRYNAGWCWIHDPSKGTCCILFIKNFIDQAYEIAVVPNLLPLTSILRIDTEDVVLYPLICADLISNQEQSPRVRIARSLPPNRKRVAICTVSCTAAPESGWWRTAIDAAVQMHQQQAIVIFANQDVTEIKAEEEDDRWRCLTGAFISRTRMTRPPRSPLHFVRHIATEAAAGGLILRNPHAGVATGTIGWDCNPAIGLYVWEPQLRLFWRDQTLQPIIERVEAYEIRRFLMRRATTVALPFAQQVRASITQALIDVAAQQNTNMLTPRLWPDLLDGIRPPQPPRSADELYFEQDYLERGLGVFVAMQEATNAQPLIAGRKRGQMSWGDKELRIWVSPRLREDEMFRSLEELALESGSAPPLIVIGRGRGLGSDILAQPVLGREPIPPSRVTPDRQTDFTSATPNTDDAAGIESARIRRIFWQRMSNVEEVLVHPPPAVAPAICAAIIHGLALN
jgi:hypothetical protein